jgi:DNA-directed RNA polymerase specialized sigma24 family protein
MLAITFWLFLQVPRAPMSPAFPIDRKNNRLPLESSLWINPVDKTGKSVDQKFIDAAKLKAPDLMRYRARELRDGAVRLNLIEAAVHRASRARKREPVHDFGAYIFTVFTRLVDTKIEVEKRLVSVDADCLEDFSAQQSDQDPGIDEAIHQGQILDAMEESTRWAWSRRLLGYEVQEIAAELNISADCLSTRMRRGLKAAAAKLLGLQSNERQ